MADTSLKIEEQQLDRVLVMTVAGRIDSGNAAEFMGRLTGLLTAGARAILVDLGRVLYLTSAGFRALIVATDTADQRSAKLALCGMSPDLRELFEIGGMLDLFQIFGTREDGLSGMH
jgi:anti-anti-sigma factor